MSAIRKTTMPELRFAHYPGRANVEGMVGSRIGVRSTSSLHMVLVVRAVFDLRHCVGSHFFTLPGLFARK